MDQTTFFKIIFSDEEALRWVLAYLSVGYDQKTPVFEMLENVRAGLVPDMEPAAVIEQLTETIRSYFA